MNNRLAFITSLICIVACFSDILVTIILGAHYPGYSQFRDTLSQMGADISPVSRQMSLWWIILGSMFVISGICFRRTFLNANRHVKLVSWLLIIYGVGEGISSGLFPMSYSEEGFDLVSYLHLALSGLGVLAIIVLPLIVQKIFTRESFPKFYRYSYVVVVLGLIFIGFFSLSKSIEDPQNYIVQYKGLWQRVLSLNFYCYLMVLVVLMLMNRSTQTPDSTNSTIK